MSSPTRSQIFINPFTNNYTSHFNKLSCSHTHNKLLENLSFFVLNHWKVHHNCNCAKFNGNIVGKINLASEGAIAEKMENHLCFSFKIWNKNKTKVVALIEIFVRYNCHENENRQLNIDQMRNSRPQPNRSEWNVTMTIVLIFTRHVQSLVVTLNWSGLSCTKRVSRDF